MRDVRKLTAVALAALLALPAVAQAKTTLELWSFLDPAGDSVRSKGVKHVIDTFQQKYPDIEVKVSVIAWNQIGAAFMRAATAHKTPDVTMINSVNIRKHIAAGTIQSLEPYFEKLGKATADDYVLIPTAIDDNKRYGVCYEVRAFGLIYRPDLLRKAGLGVPESLDELTAASKKLQEMEGKDFVGFGMGFNPANDRAVKGLLPMAVGLGAKIIGADGKAVFDEEPTRKALAVFEKMVKVDKIMPLDVALMDVVNVRQMAEAGRIGFSFHGTHWLNAMRQKAAPGTEFSWMPMPGFEKGKTSPCMMECWNLTVPTAAKNPDAAWKLIEHWTSPEIQKWQVENVGYVPIRASVTGDPSFNKPELAHIKTALKYMSGNPLHFDWPESTDVLQDTLGHAITATLSGKETADQALKEAEKNYNNMAR